MTALAQTPHPVPGALRAARTALSEVSESPVWSMNGEETAAAIVAADALEAQVVQLRARLLRQAKTLDLHGAMGARRLGQWDAQANLVTRPAGHRRAWLADKLEAHPLVDRALLEGGVNVEQADAILRGLEKLPADFDPELRVKAEEHLVGLAADHDAKALRNLARHLLEVVSPETADEQLAAQLEREEREAEAANRLRFWEDEKGRGHGTFTLDPFSFACFKKAIFAKAAPKHRASKGKLGDRLPRTEELGQAFADYVRRYPTKKLPTAGGLNATVVVLMPFETLMGGLRSAQLDTGLEISAAQARQIACEAGIIPAVLGGASEVLDLGRSKRFHSRAQRIVATIEQGGCIAEGHDCPPALTQMHHPDLWSEGGQTNRDGWMLCPPAHRQCHDPRYRAELMPNGKVRFHRRT